MPNVIDQFVSALSGNNAQEAGTLLEQLAASKGLPPALVAQAAQTVGLVRDATGWTFQSVTDPNQIATLAQSQKEKQPVSAVSPPNPTAPLPLPNVKSLNGLGGIQNG